MTTTTTTTGKMEKEEMEKIVDNKALGYLRPHPCNNCAVKGTPCLTYTPRGAINCKQCSQDRKKNCNLKLEAVIRIGQLGTGFASQLDATYTRSHFVDEIVMRLAGDKPYAAVRSHLLAIRQQLRALARIGEALVGASVQTVGHSNDKYLVKMVTGQMEIDAAGEGLDDDDDMVIWSQTPQEVRASILSRDKGGGGGKAATKTEVGSEDEDASLECRPMKMRKGVKKGISTNGTGKLDVAEGRASTQEIGGGSGRRGIPRASTVGSSVMEMATNMNLHSTEKNPIRNRTHGADLEGRIITAGMITKAKTGRPKPRAITRASRGDAVVFGKVSK